MKLLIKNIYLCNYKNIYLCLNNIKTLLNKTKNM